jgi:uncharacterized protein YgiM (DUF1202 family)
MATAAFVISLSSARILAAESPAPIPGSGIPATAATATPAAATTTAAALKPFKKRFLLSHSSSVYQQPDKTSAVIANVRRKTHVSVTGVTGDWLQIRLSNGKVGFIPSSAAE